MKGTGVRAGNDWDARQIKAIELLAQGTLTLTDVQRLCKVSNDTLWKWRKNPQFRAAVLTRARELLSEELPEIYAALSAKAKKGDPQHIKLVLQHMEHLESSDMGIVEGSISFNWKTEWDKDKDEE